MAAIISRSEDEAPHSRCNFLDDDKMILVGARPEPFTIESILSCVSLFINLDNDPKSSWYVEELPDTIKYINISTPPGRAPPISQAEKAVIVIKQHMESGGKIYIHCNGGHGRAGTFAAFLLGCLYDMKADDAIKQVETKRELRTDKSRNFVPTPETNAQVAFLVKYLGMNTDSVVPDRSDRSWLKRVRAERKK